MQQVSLRCYIMTATEWCTNLMGHICWTTSSKCLNCDILFRSLISDAYLTMSLIGMARMRSSSVWISTVHPVSALDRGTCAVYTRSIPSRRKRPCGLSFTMNTISAVKRNVSIPVGYMIGGWCLKVHDFPCFMELLVMSLSPSMHVRWAHESVSDAPLSVHLSACE